MGTVSCETDVKKMSAVISASLWLHVLIFTLNKILSTSAADSDRGWSSYYYNPEQDAFTVNTCKGQQWFKIRKPEKKNNNKQNMITLYTNCSLCWQTKTWLPVLLHILHLTLLSPSDHSVNAAQRKSKTKGHSRKDEKQQSSRTANPRMTVHQKQ